MTAIRIKEKIKRLEFAHRYLVSQIKAIETILRGDSVSWEPLPLETGTVIPNCPFCSFPMVYAEYDPEGNVTYSCPDCGALAIRT